MAAAPKGYSNFSAAGRNILPPTIFLLITKWLVRPRSLVLAAEFAYISDMLWRNSRGRPLNAPAAFIHPCRPRRRKCISAYSYSLLRLVSAILVLPMPIRLSAERQPFDIIALPKKYRNIFESIPIAYGVVAVVMIARASLAPSKMLNTTLKKQFLNIARTADRSLTAMSAG